MFEWFSGIKLHHFWEPITASSTADWRRTHIEAHLIGGAVWLVVHAAIAAALGAPWSLTTHPGLRIGLVGIWQAVGWEWTQHENWRPELVTPPLPPGHGYPWLSAFWDTIFAVLGAAIAVLLITLA